LASGSPVRLAPIPEGLKARNITAWAEGLGATSPKFHKRCKRATPERSALEGIKNWANQIPVFSEKLAVRNIPSRINQYLPQQHHQAYLWGGISACNFALAKAGCYRQSRLLGSKGILLGKTN